MGLANCVPPGSGSVHHNRADDHFEQHDLNDRGNLGGGTNEWLKKTEDFSAFTDFMQGMGVETEFLVEVETKIFDCFYLGD